MDMGSIRANGEVVDVRDSIRPSAEVDKVVSGAPLVVDVAVVVVAVVLVVVVVEEAHRRISSVR
jgi:hypothetical protein